MAMDDEEATATADVETATTDTSADTGADTAATETATPETTDTGAAPATEGASEKEPAAGDTERKDSSSTTDSEQSESQPQDWEKRFKGSQAAYTRLRQETLAKEKEWQEKLADLERRMAPFKEVDPQQLQSYVEQQRTRSIPVWNPTHPDHQRFQALLTRVEEGRRLIASAQTPEQRQWAEAHFNRSFDQNEVQIIKAYQVYAEQERQRQAMDPAGYIRQHVQAYLQETLPRMQDAQEATRAAQERGFREAQEWVEKAKPSDQDKAKVADLIRKGYQFDAAVAIVERDALRAHRSDAEKAQRSAQAKNALLKSNAAIDRDPASGGMHQSDVYQQAKAEAKKRGWRDGDPRFMDLLDRLQAKVAKPSKKD